MKNINAYHRQLSSSEIKENEHRNFVGGMWDEIGQLQIEFLIKQGLQPNHKLLDIACGCLRGGLHFVDYLEQGNYFGIDINASLINAGKLELDSASLTHKLPSLLVNDCFEFSLFEEQFNYMLSVSLFTHLPMNMILRCLKNAKQCLQPGGSYFSTFFEAPTSVCTEVIVQHPGKKKTYFDKDPFHYSIEEIKYMASCVGFKVDIIGDWEHPRNQKMARFHL